MARAKVLKPFKRGDELQVPGNIIDIPASMLPRLNGLVTIVPDAPPGLHIIHDAQGREVGFELDGPPTQPHEVEGSIEDNIRRAADMILGADTATVRCGDCRNFERNPQNPAEGAGNCKDGMNPDYPYPAAQRRCHSHVEVH